MPLSIERVILHIGPHKTGSSAIQLALSTNREALARKGYLYPDIGYEYYAHHGIVEACELRRPWKYQDLARQLESQRGSLILSSENFARMDIDAVRRLFDLIGRRVELVYYVRNPLDTIFSWWQEQIKHGYVEALSSFVNQLPVYPILEISNILSPWSYYLTRERFRLFPYDSRLDVAQHFFERVLGIGYEPVPQATNFNASLPTLIVEAIRYANQLGKRGRRIIDVVDVKAQVDRVLRTAQPKWSEVEVSLIDQPFKTIREDYIANWKPGFVVGAEPFEQPATVRYKYIADGDWPREFGLLDAILDR